MRCPDCNKFASYEGDETPEWDTEPEFDPETRLVTGSVRAMKNCAECGTELKELFFDVDVEVGVQELHDGLVTAGYILPMPPGTVEWDQAVDTLPVDWSVDGDALEAYEETITTRPDPKTGREVPLARRGWRTRYGYVVELELTVADPNGRPVVVVTLEARDTAAAGEFEELA